MQIAIYGKGGIGKSTVSANLSAALGLCGRRVLQIGCDPKHDSTRLLHHGQQIPTVLNYLLDVPVDQQRAQDVLLEGFAGVKCVEAGGPRSGMGCAGRGILTAFDFLEKHRVFDEFDTIVYDVLGDVVCGGFAVPVRRQYADAVFLVTSGEAMSIYAANNILQGICNLSPGEHRIAGIIYNSRGVGDEAERVEAFARAVELPICLRIPRSPAFAQAEMQAVTLVESDSESSEAQLFLSLAQRMAEGLTLYEAKPLSEEGMERFMRGDAPIKKAVPPKIPATPPKRDAAPIEGSFLPTQKRALSDPFSRIPLYGCAFNGAVALAIHVKDAAILCHSSKNCIWFSANGFSAYACRGMYTRGILYPAFVPCNLEATDIDMQDAVFGGVEHARRKALALAARGAKTIIVITSCIPGLCGDDLLPLKRELAALGCEMILVRTDGVEAGDYNEGMALCYRTLAREGIRRNVEKDPAAINIVYEHVISSQTDQNYEVLREMLEEMGLYINCRFLCASSMEEIHRFLAAPYSVMARSDVLGEEIQHLLESEYGCSFLPGTLPRGCAETVRWLELLGQLYGREREAERLIQNRLAIYREAIDALKPSFHGKRVLLCLSDGNNDWIFELAQDLELEIVQTLLQGKPKDENPGWNRRFSAHWSQDRQSALRAAQELAPDVILTNSMLATELSDGKCVISVQRDLPIGFMAGVQCARDWVKIMENSLEGGWKRDRTIFEKYLR